MTSSRETDGLWREWRPNPTSPSQNSDTAVPGTHRAKGPLFALGGRTSVRGETVPPGRAKPGRRPGRPSKELAEAEGPTPAPTCQLWPRWQWLRPTTVCLANRWHNWKA